MVRISEFEREQFNKSSTNWRQRYLIWYHAWYTYRRISKITRRPTFTGVVVRVGKNKTLSPVVAYRAQQRVCVKLAKKGIRYTDYPAGWIKIYF